MRNLALQYPTSPLRSGPLLIYLTARSAERGEEAVKTLNADPQLKRAKVLAQDGGDTTIKYRSLDISDKTSIHAFRDFVKKTHPEGIDVLVNNAAIALNGFGMFFVKGHVTRYHERRRRADAKADDIVAKETIHTNYYGTLAMTQDLLPLIRPGGRLVNVASGLGGLSNYSAPLQKSFISASKTSVSASTALMEKFISDVKSGKHEAEGWPSAAYAVSKAGVIAMTKAVAAEEEKSGRGVLVNVCCPGYVNTDMSKGKGVKTPDEGSRTPVLIALGEFGGTSGDFWQSEKIIEW